MGYGPYFWPLLPRGRTAPDCPGCVSNHNYQITCTVCPFFLQNPFHTMVSTWLISNPIHPPKTLGNLAHQGDHDCIWRPWLFSSDFTVTVGRKFSDWYLVNCLQVLLSCWKVEPLTTVPLPVTAAPQNATLEPILRWVYNTELPGLFFSLVHTTLSLTLPFILDPYHPLNSTLASPQPHLNPWNALSSCSESPYEVFYNLPETFRTRLMNSVTQKLSASKIT